jgi:Anti-repressor SinI
MKKVWLFANDDGWIAWNTYMYFGRVFILTNRELDLEWMELIKQALDTGISKQEIREFLHNQTQELKAGYKVI